MEISLISHASVLIDAGGTRIWTDPWTAGRAFNNSWSLLGAPAYTPAMLDDIGYLWISHEHPDHFNVPTLKALPEDFKRRVVVLFQQHNSDKVFAALRAFGFVNVRSLPNGKMVSLAQGMEVMCYQASFGDSCLAVRHGGEVIFNVNDAELSATDCRRILRRLGKVDVVLNQFSLAGYNGYPHRERVLPVLAEEKLARLLDNHRELGARVTIPFASFVYFSSNDNRYLNAYANSPARVASYMREHGARVGFLYLGEGATVTELAARDRHDQHDKQDGALNRWQALHEQVDRLDYSSDAPVALPDIARRAGKFSGSLREFFPSFLIRRIKPISFFLPDLGHGAHFDVATGLLEQAPIARVDADIVVNSQPLEAAFSYPSGFETLAVSGRFEVQHHMKNWQSLKSLTILWNNQIYLRPRFLFDLRLMRYLAARIRSGLLRQMLGKARLRAAVLRREELAGLTGSRGRSPRR